MLRRIIRNVWALISVSLLILPGVVVADHVLVLGGSGQLGARVVRLLLDQGHYVSILVRPTSDRARLENLNVAYVVGDLLDAEQVAAAIASVKPAVIINTVRAPISDLPFYKITSENIVRAAVAQDVRQIIHHGAVGAGDNMQQFPDIPWDSMDGLKDRMLDHGVAEQNFLGSGLAVTIIRNSRVWPDETPSTGKATLSEDHSVITPITRADLAILTMQCLMNSSCAGKIYHATDQSLVGLPRPNEPQS